MTLNFIENIFVEGAKVLSTQQDAKLTEVGVITSGGPSPSLGKNIAMGYVLTPYSKLGTVVNVEVRGKTWPTTVTKMPFNPARYYKPSQA